MVTHILVIAALLAMEEYKPMVISPHATYDECAKAAQKANQQDERLQTKDAKEVGLRYVCLKVLGDA